MTKVSYDLPYSSQRFPVLAGNVVATSQPLAAQAGLQMMQQGGNAVDAALATAIALTVVEPTGNGIGADAFAIVWDGQEMHGLNGSGRSPADLTRERFGTLDAIPLRGWNSVTVPGAVAAWAELSRRFGRLPFARLFEPAIRYATDGFAVSPSTARMWARAEATFKGFDEFGKAFLPEGRAPRPGERFRHPEQARTLESIADSHGESFYRGHLAQEIAAYAKRNGAVLGEADLAAHRSEWVGTLSQRYHEVELHEIPPNGQGMAALMALGILEHHPLAELPVDSADSLHLQIEAMKLAFADVHRHLAEAEAMTIPVESLLDEGYLRERARCIDMKEARDPQAGRPQNGGTVYLTTADQSGMMVSFIQSNYYGFGSGIVVPGTGIALQNRGAGFVLERGHPNEVAGSKRPLHTIIPGFLTRGGQPLMSFGVMGGPMQPQGHVQMVTRLRDYGQNPQAASDAPRWQVTGGLEVAVEAGVSAEVVNDLRARGHQITLAPPEDSFAFGGAQLVLKLEDAYLAASDHRKDGQAVGY
ncbi:MAG: gamma-glutamyltransferase family protein [Trueperaceae bacterium]